MAAMPAKTPLSALKCARPFIPETAPSTCAKPTLSSGAKPFIPKKSAQCQAPVAWLQVMIARDMMPSSPDTWHVTTHGEELDRGRANTRDTPKRLASRTPSPSGFSVCYSEVSTSADSASSPTESVSDRSTVADPIEHAEDLTVSDASIPPTKNTFVHFGNINSSAGGLTRSSSAPSLLLTCDFKRLTMPEMHALGTCSPCAYLYTKADGCRLGPECKFCHMCPADEIKKRKKQKLRDIKARKAAMKAQEEAECA